MYKPNKDKVGLITGNIHDGKTPWKMVKI